MGGADADFVFGANHAEALDATDFAFLDFEFLVAVIEGCADGGDHDGLTSGHVGRAAYNLGGLPVAQVNGGDVKMVRVGVFHAGEHFADYEAAQAAANRFHALDCAGFEAD